MFFIWSSLLIGADSASAAPVRVSIITSASASIIIFFIKYILLLIGFFVS